MRKLSVDFGKNKVMNITIMYNVDDPDIGLNRILMEGVDSLVYL